MYTYIYIYAYTHAYIIYYCIIIYIYDTWDRRIQYHCHVCSSIFQTEIIGLLKWRKGGKTHDCQPFSHDFQGKEWAKVPLGCLISCSDPSSRTLFFVYVCERATKSVNLNTAILRECFLSGGMTIPKHSYIPMDMYDTIILANSIFHNQFFLGITAHKWSNTIQAIHFCFYISTIAGCTLRRKGRIAKMARWGAWMGFGIALGQGFQCFWPCNAMRFRGKSEIRPSNISGWLSLTRTLSKFLGNLVWDGPGERDATTSWCIMRCWGD